MGGRPSKTTAELKGHRTKAELEFRKNFEETLVTGKQFKELEKTKSNLVAHQEFLKLKKLFNGLEYVDGLDEQIINRYCLELANQSSLVMLLDKMESKIEEVTETKELVNLYKSISGVLNNINKSKEMLFKFEDRLFLNPATRIKSIPKQPEQMKEASGIAAFMAKRNTG